MGAVWNLERTAAPECSSEQFWDRIGLRAGHSRFVDELVSCNLEARDRQRPRLASARSEPLQTGRRDTC